MRYKSSFYDLKEWDISLTILNYSIQKKSLTLLYEVIPENAVCKLYFDLEFNKLANPGADGKKMVALLIEVTFRFRFFSLYLLVYLSVIQSLKELNDSSPCNIQVQCFSCFYFWLSFLIALLRVHLWKGGSFSLCLYISYYCIQLRKTEKSGSLGIFCFLYILLHYSWFWISNESNFYSKNWVLR